MKAKSATVSFDDERLMLVDSDDVVTGYETKLTTHLGKGLLHRAFSIFIINDKSQVALQQRSRNKPLWPCYWANSCCSHPREGETTINAAYRRLNEELGIRTRLQYLYKFEYRSEYENIGTEHELCSVFVGYVDSNTDLNPNETEVEKISWIGWEEIKRWIDDPGIPTTPWLGLEWSYLNQNYQDVISKLQKSPPIL